MPLAGGLKNPNIQANEKGEQMHMGVACDNCGQCPIVGQRFNSQVVNNYDLCERCHELPGAKHVAPFRLVQNEEGVTWLTPPCKATVLDSSCIHALSMPVLATMQDTCA